MRRLAAAVALGLALCLLAAGFAITSLYLVGLALVLSSAAAAGWVRLGARHARVVRSVGASAVEEQAALTVTVEVIRGGWLTPGAELRAWPEADPRPARRAGTAGVSATVRFPRRGWHRLGPASLQIVDPLALCARTIISSADEVLVLPRLAPVRREHMEGDPALTGRQVAIAAEAGATEVDSLRPHRPGTPASRIHWPTVARTSELIERRLVIDADQAPVVVMDPRDPETPEALDQAVRAAASLCAYLAERGGCALLLPGDRRPAPIDTALRGFARAHAALAVLGPEAGAPHPGGLIGTAVVLWVTAARGNAGVLRDVPAPARYLVSPYPVGAWPVAFTVAGCSGQRLDHLQAARIA